MSCSPEANSSPSTCSQAESDPCTDGGCERGLITKAFACLSMQFCLEKKEIKSSFQLKEDQCWDTDSEGWRHAGWRGGRAGSRARGPSPPGRDRGTRPSPDRLSWGVTWRSAVRV